MALSASLRRKRNEKVTKMLNVKCNIEVVTVGKDEAVARGNWFIPTKKSEGELKLVYKK